MQRESRFETTGTFMTLPISKLDFSKVRDELEEKIKEEVKSMKNKIFRKR